MRHRTRLALTTAGLAIAAMATVSACHLLPEDACGTYPLPGVVFVDWGTWEGDPYNQYVCGGRTEESIILWCVLEGQDPQGRIKMTAVPLEQCR